MYDAVYAYCIRHGFIKNLKAQLKIPEEHRFNQKNVSKEGLHILDAVHCVYDKKRTFFFLDELHRYVKPQSTIIEAGIGTGILALFAGTRAKHVYGYEINKTILNLAEDIQNSKTIKTLLRTFPVFKAADATKVSLPSKADIIVSENIYTGMFFEKQVQIMNHLLPKLQKKGRVIPERLDSYIILSEATFPHKPKSKELFVPDPTASTSMSRNLAAPILYSSIDFRKKTDLNMEAKLRIPITKSGELNSVLIYSEVGMPSGRTIKRNATIFLNNDILLALGSTKTVKKGNVVELILSYSYGSKPSSAVLKADIIK